MSFMKLLQEHRHGNTHEDISEQIRTLVAAVSDEHKAGKLVITLSIKPLAKGDGLEVSIDSKLTPPKPSVGVSLFFATVGNDLTRVDPRQQTMELREAPPAHVARNLA
jgi:hypothetical protein